MFKLRFDGLFRSIKGAGEPLRQAGFMCYGWIITDKRGVVAHGHGGFAGYRNANSNVAEYLALVEGLDALFDLSGAGHAVQVCGDAKSVIEQMRGAADVNASSIRSLHRRARKLADQFETIEWTWTPRRENHAADALTRRALRQMRLDRERYQNILRDLTKAHASDHPANDHLRSLLDLRIYQPRNRNLRLA